MKRVDEMRTKDNKDEGQRTGLCKAVGVIAQR